MEKSIELQAAIEIAEVAGQLITININSQKEINTKTSDKDLVTEIDKQVEEVIRNIILDKFPSHQVLGEEEVNPGAEASVLALSEKETAENLWIIDPIDGTTNFIHDFPFFCVSIAFAQKGIVKSGLVYSPMTDELFIAEKGKGAMLNGNPINVSQEKALSESLVSTNIPKVNQNVSVFSQISKEARNVLTLGAAALQLAYVAAGRLSGYWEYGLNSWDVAAGSLIVQEAGGQVTEVTGTPYNIRIRDVLATNKFIHNELVKKLND